MKILVTGANGYIGSKVVRYLCDLGIDVVAADLTNDNVDCRSTFVNCNIFDNNTNLYSLLGKPDICLHLAWRDGFKHNSFRHMAELSSHFSFLSYLVDCGIRALYCMGTMHEIGYYEGKVDENTPCSPMNLYGIAKNALRQSIGMYCKQKECRFVWLRAFYIYGDDTVGNSVFCKLRQAANEGVKNFPINSGKNCYDFININKLVQQIVACCLNDDIKGIVNCCSGKPISLFEMLNMYITLNKLPIKLDIGKYPERPYDSPCIYGDNSIITSVLKEFAKKFKLKTFE